jgi:oligopeptide transport system substrate-binding protein
MSRFSHYRILLVLLSLVGCSSSTAGDPWNDPYPAGQTRDNIYYDSFEERPKHLDPATSYVSNEYEIIGQIYEPPLQYHFLKRPYELIPLTATAMPRVQYFDRSGNLLDDTAPATEVQRAVYTISIRPGILFQPHPAFAKDSNNNYLYHNLGSADLADKHVLADFRKTGTRELTAEDYVYEIKRLVHPGINSPIGGLMSKYILGLKELSDQLERDHGASPQKYLDLREYPLAGARAIDRYTYQITLKEKYPQLRYWLSMNFFAPMPWEADRFYSQPGMAEKNIVLDWYPVGTGPFMLTENNPNRRMVLVRNPNFRGEVYPAEGEASDDARGFLADAGKTIPFVDKAVFSLEKESIPAWNKFLQGYYDVSGIQSDNFDQAVQFNARGDAQVSDEMKAKGIHLISAVATSSYYMGFNMQDDVVGGTGERARLLRRAISIALDYEEFISIFANGRGVPAQGPIPPGIFGFVKGEPGINPYVYTWRDGKPVRRSIGEARQLLAKAGYPDGRDQNSGQPLVLYLDTPQAGPGAKAVLDWYRKQFATLGIQLVVRATDFNRFQEKVNKGTVQIFTWGWNADYPDPENFMFLLYGPNIKVGKQGENISNYENGEFDRLFDRMKNMSNGPERQAIIDKMVEIVRRDAPWLWGYHPVGFALYHDWYHNAKPNLMANNTLKYKRVDPELRERMRREWNQPVIWPIVILLIIFAVSLVPAWRAYKSRERARAL